MYQCPIILPNIEKTENQLPTINSLYINQKPYDIFIKFKFPAIAPIKYIDKNILSPYKSYI